MAKNIWKRFLSITLVLVMLVGFVPALPAFADTSFANNLLEFSFTNSNSNGSGNVSASGSTLNLSVSNSVFQSGCMSDTPAAANTLTVTVTAVKAIQLNSVTLTLSGDTNYNSVHNVSVTSGILSPGDEITIVLDCGISSDKDETTHTVKAAIAFSAVELSGVTITAAPSIVEYDLAGHHVSSDAAVEFEASIGSSISLPNISAPNGYVFYGWRVDGQLTTDSQFTVSSPCTVYPVIESSSTELHEQIFQVGSTYYTCWEDAMGAAKNGSDHVVILVNKNYTLPSS